MNYSVVYDVLEDRVASGLWLGLFFGLIVTAVISVINWKRRRVPRLVMPLIALGWAFGWSSLIYAQHLEISSCQRLLETGAVKVVEGTVQDFVPMPYEGHALESFVVKGVRFRYSDFDVSQCGFRNTTSHGGPIRPGLAVRITYLGNSILRLEVARPATAPKSGA